MYRPPLLGIQIIGQVADIQVVIEGELLRVGEIQAEIQGIAIDMRIIFLFEIGEEKRLQDLDIHIIGGADEKLEIHAQKLMDGQDIFQRIGALYIVPLILIILVKTVVISLF